MCKLLVIFAYTPDVKHSNKYHTSLTHISFPQHTHEDQIYTIGKTFVTHIKLMGLHNVNRNKHFHNMQFARKNLVFLLHITAWRPGKKSSYE